jgi:hypothetical protein
MKKTVIERIKSQVWDDLIFEPLHDSEKVYVEETTIILGKCKRTIWSWMARGLMPPTAKNWNKQYWLRSDILRLNLIIRGSLGENDHV